MSLNFGFSIWLRKCLFLKSAILYGQFSGWILQMGFHLFSLAVEDVWNIVQARFSFFSVLELAVRSIFDENFVAEFWNVSVDDNFLRNFHQTGGSVFLEQHWYQLVVKDWTGGWDWCVVVSVFFYLPLALVLLLRRRRKLMANELKWSVRGNFLGVSGMSAWWVEDRLWTGILWVLVSPAIMGSLDSHDMRGLDQWVFDFLGLLIGFIREVVFFLEGGLGGPFFLSLPSCKLRTLHLPFLSWKTEKSIYLASWLGLHFFKLMFHMSEDRDAWFSCSHEW